MRYWQELALVSGHARMQASLCRCISQTGRCSAAYAGGSSACVQFFARSRPLGATWVHSPAVRFSSRKRCKLSVIRGCSGSAQQDTRYCHGCQSEVSAWQPVTAVIVSQRLLCTALCVQNSFCTSSAAVFCADVDWCALHACRGVSTSELQRTAALDQLIDLLLSARSQQEVRKSSPGHTLVWTVSVWHSLAVNLELNTASGETAVGKGGRRERPVL